MDTKKIPIWAITAMLALQVPTTAFAAKDVEEQENSNEVVATPVDETSNSAVVGESENDTAEHSESLYQEYFSSEHPWEDSKNSSFQINGNLLVGYDSQGNEKVYFESDGAISNLFTSNELVFFRVDDTIYRLHIDSGIVDEFYSNNDIVDFFPETSEKIVYTEYTAEAKEAMAQGHPAYDLDLDIRWNTATEFDFNTKSESEYVSDNSILGVDLEISDNEISPRYQDLSKFGPIKINAKTIPHPSYGIGATGASWSGSGTCVAHAKYIYNYIWGSVNYGTAVYDQTFTTPEAFQRFVKGLKPGARMTIYRPDGSSHTFVLVAKGTNDFTAYHSNYGNNNKVTITKFTYAEIAKQYNRTSFYRPQSKGAELEH